MHSQSSQILLNKPWQTLGWISLTIFTILKKKVRENVINFGKKHPLWFFSFSFICKQKMTVEHSGNCKLRSIFSKVISTFRIFHNFFPNFLELHLRTKNGKTAPYYNVSILKYSLCVFCCFFHFFSFSQWVKIVCFLSPSLILNLPWKKKHK